jgi:uncharacterized membrane protein YhaH (DUF805 family)
MQQSFIALAFKPLHDMFVFSGRSRRTEVVGFFILGTIANAATLTVENGGIVFEAIKLAWAFLWGFPWLALLIRRLHDQGRSAGRGWVLAAGFAALLATAPLLQQSPDSIYHVGLFHRVFHPVGPLAVAHGIAAGLLTLVLFGLFLWPEEPGANRFGPDPRLGPGDSDELVTH